VLRYSKLGYVALNVTDTARSRVFYEEMIGLQYAGTGAEGEVFLRCSADHHNLILYPSATPGLRRLGWEMDGEEQLERLAAHAHALGIAVAAVEPARRRNDRIGRAYRLREPNTGVCFEFYDAMTQFAGSPFRPTVAKIQRLGHVVLKAVDYDAVVSLLTESFSFRVSDAVDGLATFMRCFPNPFHHSLAVTRGSVNALHHVNFMVSEIDDIGRAMTRFKRHDVPIVHGPGRHPPSDSVFLYFLDPDGLTLEYSFGMEEFAEDGARRPRLMEPVPESFDYWGNVADPRKSVVGAIDRESV